MALMVHANDGRLLVSHGMDGSMLRKANRYKCYNNMRRKLGQFFNMTTDEVRYAHNRNSRGKLVPALITLTYPDNSAWEPKQIAKFINNLRNYADRNWGLELRYAWVAESTKKGIIHYHVVVWHPRNKKFPKPDKQGWWSHGLSQIAGVKKGVGKYMMKYLTKGSDLGIERYNDKGNKVHIRTYAVGGLTDKESELLSHFMLPKDVKRAFGPIPFGVRIKRSKGGWKCENFRSKIKKIGGYFFWGCHDLFIPGNWLLSRSIETGLWYLEGGVSWSELPDEPLPDIILPF